MRPEATANKRGFTLVELLVTVAIVGILAAVALPQYAVYKKNAVDAQMENDLHHARIAMEHYYERSSYSYVGATVPDLIASDGLIVTPGVTIAIVSATDTDFSVRTCAPNGNFPSYLYDTTNGSILGDSGSCP